MGLPTALVFANSGYKVVGVDTNPTIVRELNRGNNHVQEPNLKNLLNEVISSKNFMAQTEVGQADVFIICVPTPINDTKHCNLGFITTASKMIAKKLKEGDLVVVESTVPPGTIRNTILPTLKKSFNKNFYLAHAPERVMPGNILKEIIENDRIIGGINRKSAKITRTLYSSFVKGKIFLTNLETAEMSKLVENTYRDVNIAFANELTKICDRLGIDIWEVITLANNHPRVNIHYPGPGVGGHCIPLVPWFIIEKAPEESRMIRLAREINEGMPEYVSKIVKELIGNGGATITIFGASYKGNVEDARVSPSAQLAKHLRGYNIRFYDNCAKWFKYDIADLKSAVSDSECIVVMVDHDEFKNMTKKKIEQIGSLMKNRIVIDTKNCLQHEIWGMCEFDVYILGNSKEGTISSHIFTRS